MDKTEDGAGKNTTVSSSKDHGNNVVSEDRTGQAKSPQEIISEHMRELQKKSAAKRKQNDPNTYKKMINSRWEKEKEEDLKIITE